MSDEEEPSYPIGRLQELVPCRAGSVRSALVGLALGGPAAVIAGAVAGPALEHSGQGSLALRYRRGERAYEYVKGHGDPASRRRAGIISLRAWPDACGRLDCFDGISIPKRQRYLQRR